MKKKHGGEHILVPAGEGRLALQELERACSKRLAKLLSDTALWPTGGDGPVWTTGDFRILIVETTVAPDAVLYVQFWSEPEQPVLWEVCSGHCNPAARRFVTRHARRALADMNFRVRGSARNFGKKVTISNKGDAAAVVRDVLRIFHDVLGYRGKTALVARTIAGGRSGRAVVHTELTPEDAVALLGRLSYETELQRRKPRPVVFAQRDGFRFVVTFDVPDDHGIYRCFDFTAIVGRISNATTSAWANAVNELNAGSRVARAWIDGEANVAVGTSFCLRGGLTEAYLADQIDAWRHAAEQLVGGPTRVKDREAAPDDQSDESGPKEVLH